MESTSKFPVLLYVCVSVCAFVYVCVFMCAQRTRGHVEISHISLTGLGGKTNSTQLTLTAGLTGIMSVSVENHESTNVEVTNLVVGRSVKESILQNVTAELTIVGWVGFCLACREKVRTRCGGLFSRH